MDWTWSGFGANSNRSPLGLPIYGFSVTQRQHWALLSTVSGLINQQCWLTKTPRGSHQLSRSNVDCWNRQVSVGSLASNQPKQKSATLLVRASSGPRFVLERGRAPDYSSTLTCQKSRILLFAKPDDMKRKKWLRQLYVFGPKDRAFSTRNSTFNPTSNSTFTGFVHAICLEAPRPKLQISKASDLQTFKSSRGNAEWSLWVDSSPAPTNHPALPKPNPTASPPVSLTVLTTCSSL